MDKPFLSDKFTPITLNGDSSHSAFDLLNGSHASRRVDPCAVMAPLPGKHSPFPGPIIKLIEKIAAIYNVEVSTTCENPLTKPLGQILVTHIDVRTPQGGFPENAKMFVSAFHRFTHALLREQQPYVTRILVGDENCFYYQPQEGEIKISCAALHDYGFQQSLEMWNEHLEDKKPHIRRGRHTNGILSSREQDLREELDTQRAAQKQGFVSKFTGNATAPSL